MEARRWDCQVDATDGHRTDSAHKLPLPACAELARPAGLRFGIAVALLFAAMPDGSMTDGQRIGCREDPTCDVDRLRRGPLCHDFSIAMPVGDIGPCGSFLFFR